MHDEHSTNTAIGKFSFFNVLYILAAFVVVIAGMKAAAPILVPFLVAGFIALILNPMYFWIQSRGFSSTFSLIIIILVFLILSMYAASIIGKSINHFYQKLPIYQNKLAQNAEGVVTWLEGKGVEVPKEIFDSSYTAKQFFNYMVSLLGAISAQLGQMFLIVLVVIFILLEAAILPKKIQSLPNLSEDTWNRLTRIVENVRSYLAMKALMSFLTGLLIWAMLFFLGIDSPILLGTIAFILNFIPNIGSFVAGIPGVLLALLDYGIGMAVLTLVGYIVINIGISNFLEPRYMGKNLGLSPLIIILTMFFWAWVLGPVAMMISVPLTMAVKIILESSEESRWIAMLMDSEVHSLQKDG